MGLSAASSPSVAESVGEDCWSPNPARGVPVSAPATRAHISPSCVSHGCCQEHLSPSSPPVLGSMEGSTGAQTGTAEASHIPQEAEHVLVQGFRVHPYPYTGSGVGPVGTGTNVCSQLGNADSQLSPRPPALLRKNRPFQGEFALPEEPRPSQDQKGRAGKGQP